MNDSRILSFDGMRFFAILMVVIHHIQSANSLNNSVFRFVLAFSFPWFFIGSGFFIGRILMKNWEKSGRIHIMPFYGRRILRTWPSYFVGLLLTLLIIPDSDGNPHLWAYFVFMQNFFIDPKSTQFFTHSWSLAIEEQFYLLSPFLFILFFWTQKMNSLIIILLIASVGLRHYLGLNFQTPYHNSLIWSDAILIGIFFSRPSNQFIIDFLNRRALLWQLFSVLAAYVLIKNRFLIPDYYLSLLFLLSSIFMFSCYHLKSFIAKFLACRVWIILTKRSYGYYIFHVLAIFAVGHISGLELWMKVILTLMLTLLFGEISWRLIEKPILKLRDQLFPS